MRARLSYVAAAMLCLSAAFPVASANAETFPTDGQWLPVTQYGIAITDPLGDVPPSPGRDIIGTIDNPAAFFYSDGTDLYFRIRVAGNPGTPSTFTFGYGVQISTNGNPDAPTATALTKKW